MSKTRENLEIIGILTKRNMKIFLKDKMNVFFSMLAPLIVLLLYVLFLQRVQLDSINSMFSEFNLKVEKKLIQGFLDGWLISGMLSIGCITVSLSANSVRVGDRTKGVVNDIIVSPLKQHLVKISYYLFNFLVTMVIMTIVFFISLIYIGASGTWYLSAGDVFAVYGTLIYSVISATLITSFVTEFCKTEATLGALSGITSAMIGFIMGAYIPLEQMPTAVQYIAALFPGTHSAGMMREFLMTGPLEALGAALPPEILVPNAGAPWPVYIGPDRLISELSKAYCVELNFFGKYIKAGYMAIYIGATSILMFGINMLVHGRKSLASDNDNVRKSKKASKKENKEA